MKKFNKLLFTALGFVTLAGAALGTVLPVLPTTPLLLLSVFCFARGSERFHRWLLGTDLYRNHLEKFARDKSLPMKTKLAICLPVTAMLLVMLYLTPVWPARVLILGALLFKWYYFLLRLKTTASRAVKASVASKGDTP